MSQQNKPKSACILPSMFFIWPLSTATAGCLKQASEAQSSFEIFCERHADDSCQVSLCNCALHLGGTCETGTLSAAVASLRIPIKMNTLC